MKRKGFIAFMILFTIYIAVMLLISLISGAPMGSRAELNRYLFGAVGMSILLPVGFSFFFICTLDLSKKLEQSESSEESQEEKAILDISNMNVLIRQFVNAFSKKKRLTKEKREDLISYLEEYK
ncbi:MAG: hypothetical protein Q4C77_00900 [Eubacteriales bacterium]|nr:hypothetical protein [Eubacteriales bacterium]